jgi:cyclic nucleotide gated channel, plant
LQFVIWIIIPKMKESATANRKNILRFSIVFQYLPRLFQIFPLSGQIVMATGVMTETAWAGAAYNLILYMLASHVRLSGNDFCDDIDDPSCQTFYLDCKTVSSNRTIWYEMSNITRLCTTDNGFYPFGIYTEALHTKLTSSSFTQKYFYCFWWGLKNLR